MGILKRNANLFLIFSQILNPILVSVIGYLSFRVYLQGKPGFEIFPMRYQIAILVALLFTIIVFSQFEVYRPWRGMRLFQEVKTISLAWITVLLGLVMLAFLTKTTTEFSRVWTISWWTTTWLSIVLIRVSIQISMRFMRTRGWNKRQIVIAGAGALGQRIVQRIRLAEWTGLEVAAFFDDDAFLRDQKIEGIPVVNNLDELPLYVVNNEIDQVWMALPLRADERLKSTITSIHELSSAKVRMVPDIYNFPLHNYSVSEVAGLPVLNLTDSPMFGINRVVKIIVDISLSTLALIILSPLLLLIGGGVKLSSAGPVFYLQERISWNGKRFKMLKFRSMPVDAEDTVGPQWTAASDHRATRFGSLLRRTSLDELPQFINVLKGDMSIVGPRPERPVFVEQFRAEVPDYMQKHLVKAGISGWAQVNGWRGDTDLKTRIKYDIYYIENWSVWFDFKIMFLTIFKGLVNKNAY